MRAVRMQMRRAERSQKGSRDMHASERQEPASQLGLAAHMQSNACLRDIAESNILPSHGPHHLRNRLQGI